MNAADIAKLKKGTLVSVPFGVVDTVGAKDVSVRIGGTAIVSLSFDDIEIAPTIDSMFPSGIPCANPDGAPL